MRHDRIAQLSRKQPNNHLAASKPTEFWYVSEVYHAKTKRPGYIKAIKHAEDGAVRWYSVLPDKTGAQQHGISMLHDDKKQAADYVVAQRIMMGLKENGEDK